jgi:UDP-GlcNAc:undecaprenyl-phosphate GlcNAc-1-phosphate transferase
MKSLFLLGLGSLFFSVTLTPLCRDLFRRLGYVDYPDGGRKFHKGPVVRMGGLAIALAYIAAFALLYFSPFRDELLKDDDLMAVWRIFPAGLMILVTGMVDDLWGLKPWQKLVGQAVASSWAYWAGVRMAMFGGHAMGEWWSFPLTILWLVACSNAFNFIDGVDGLAAGLGFSATVTTLVAALFQDNVHLAMATVPLAGCLLGFLFFNFHPASIFMGDSGSLLIGFMLGCFGVVWSQKSATFLGMTAPLMALAVPMADISLSVVRRFIRNRPVFSADRDHIHHRLLDRGLGPRGVALVLYGVAALGAIFSLMQSVYYNQYSRLIIIAFCVGASLGIRHLNYAEFDQVRRILFGGDFGALLNARLLIEKFDRALGQTRTIEDCRNIVESACRELGYSGVKISLSGDFSECWISERRDRDQYQLVIPISGRDYVCLTRDFGCPIHPTIVTSFVDLLHRRLHQIQRQSIPAVKVASAGD